MKNSFTLFSALLFIGTYFPVFAAKDAIPPSEWQLGNYYHLKFGNDCIALDGAKPDSLVSKRIGDNASKAVIDSTLWQITEKTVAGALVYEFKNKATGALLSLPTSTKSMLLDSKGISTWTFNNGKIIGYYDKNKVLALGMPTEGLTIEESADKATTFQVEAPKNDYVLSAQELGAGLSTFYIEIGEKIEGNPFNGNELVAKDLFGEDKNYVTLQYKGNETFSNGKPLYIGIDTTCTQIDGAQDVFGYNFKADSTYAKGKLHSVSNADFQKFKFSIDLKNDSVALFVKGAPEASRTATETSTYQVVYASYDKTKRLTISKVTNKKTQGTVPFIKTKRGEPTKLPNSTGIYFLKNAGNNKYYYTPSVIKSNKPSSYLVDGQWYVKEKDGKYSIVERKSGESYAKNVEIFPVNGMDNTYTIAGKADSIAFEYQKDIDIKDKYLGILHIDDKTLKEKSFRLMLNAVGGIVPITVEDSALVTQRDSETIQLFKAIKDNESIAGGAQSVGDTLYSVSYKFKTLTNNKFVVNDINQSGRFILSNNISQTDTASIIFVNTSAKGLYQLRNQDGKFITYDVSGNLISGDQAAIFSMEYHDTPEYKMIESSHIRLESNGKFLTMNPYTMKAVLKSEGQVITKSTYLEDNFALKIETADTIIIGKPVYKLSTRIINESENDTKKRYYLTAIPSDDKGQTHYVFSADTKETPAGLFAFKYCYDEDYNGSLLLENIKSGKLVTLQNETLIESLDGLHFNIEKTTAPTAIEKVLVEASFQVAGGHNTIIIMNAKDKKVVITDILGKITGNYLITSDRFTVQTSRGINIVAVDGETPQKVIVK